MLALVMAFGLFAVMPMTASADPPVLMPGTDPPPVITSQPNNQTITEGGSTTFSVTATGTSLTYQWEYFNETSWTIVPDHPPQSTDTDTATLKMAEVGLEYNDMRFRCAVTARSGPLLNPTTTTVYSNEAKLTVTPGPTIDIGGVTGVKIAANQSGTGWTWEAATKTLTLTSAYTGQPIYIHCAATDTINLVYSGNVTITNPYHDFGALTCDGRLNMTGSGGTFTLDSSDGYGMGSTRVTINSGAYNIISDVEGLWSDGGNITISGGSVTISTSSNRGIRAYNSDVIINGGTVTISSGGNAGIEANNISISGGTVAINTLIYGIDALYNVAISGGTVAINTEAVGIHSDGGNITLSGGSGTIRTTGGTDPTWQGWAVRIPGNNSLTIGSGMQVKGWDGSSYTLSPNIATITVSGDDYTTFVDPASPGAGLKNIQFGPAAGSGGMSNFTKTRTYTSGMFTDVDENQWYGYNQSKAIAEAYEYGLVQGLTANTFNPSGNIIVGELITLAVNVRRIYEGETGALTMGEPWYMVFVDYAIAKGMIGANDFTTADYARQATRAEMAYIFSRCLPAAEYPSQNTVNSLPDVTSATPYRDAIFMLYRAGVMSGNDSAGTFLPANRMSRAEAAAIIRFVILPGTRESGKTYG